MQPMERTRLLRCITRLNTGGPTRHVALLMDGLRDRGYEQVLVHGPTAEDEGQGHIPVSGRKVTLSSLGRRISPLRDMAARRALDRLMKEHAPEIVHTHQGKAGGLARLAARRAGARAVVHTYHGHTFEGYFNRLVGAAVRRVERAAAAASHALICQSPSQERDVLRVLGRSAEGKTLVIPPAISPDAISPWEGAREAIRQSLGISADARVILLPARLVPIKRPDRALDVARHLSGGGEVHLVIAGDGPLRRDLEHRAREMGLSPHLHVLGWRTDLAELYAAADLVLLTSAMEGTPLCLLESMAVGAPVAAPDVGGVADIIDGRGLLLDPAAPTRRWADEIRASLRETRRERLAEISDQVRALHHPERLVQDVDALYRKLLTS